MAKSEIEKFIKNYLRNKMISESKEGYESWLRKNGIDPTARLSDSIGAAYAEKEKTGSKHSSVAESLSSSGLSKSGYAAYLDSSMNKRLNGRLTDAIESYLTSDLKNRTAYSSELEKQESIRKAEEEKAAKTAEKEALAAAKKAAEEAAKKEAEILKKEEAFRQQMIKDAKEKIDSLPTIDYDAAYKSATEAGLDEASAEKLAKEMTVKKRNALLEKVTSAIFSRHYTGSQAKNYAIALGLSEEDASALADIAYKANESVGDITSEKEYLDYLRGQLNFN